MFKKLKDKIAEEVKQTPIRLPTSVQQLSQQISAFSRESLGINESKRSTSNQFSIAEEDPYDNQDPQFQNVSLIDIDEPGPSVSKTSTPVPRRTRKSSQGSVGSMDRDFTVFGSSYDSSYTPYHFQSDMESVASGMSEGTGTYNSVNKEQLVHALQRAKTRYHKYKGRYQDLAVYYKELEKEREKLKNVLTETQDKALKRISDLKEQCQLEQKAKAHLEENLRADLEEKDHVISVLQSKIKLLQSKSRETSQDDLIDVVAASAEPGSAALDPNLSPREHELQERIKRYEELLTKCKEKIKTDKEKIDQMRKDLEATNSKLLETSAEAEKIKESHSSELTQLIDSLNVAREEIIALRKREESAMIASAETKQQVHSELLKQEEEMQRVKSKLGTTLTEKEALVGKVASLEKELSSLKKEYAEKSESLLSELKNSGMKAEDEKQKLVDELSRGKAEAIKIMKEQLEKESNSRWETILQERLQEVESRLKAESTRIDETWAKRFQDLEESKKLALEAYDMECVAKVSQEAEEKEKLKTEISELKSKILEIEAARDAAKEKWEEAKSEWVNQVEENRKRHLREMEEMRKEHENAIDSLLKSKDSSVSLLVEEVASKYRKEVENIQQQLEEALEASANASEACRCEVEAARAENARLLQEKEGRVQQLAEELNDSIEKLKVASNKLEETSAILKEKDEKLLSLSAELELLRKSEEILKQAKIEMEDSRKGMLDQLGSYETKVKTLEEDLLKKQREYDDLTNRIEEISKEEKAKVEERKREMTELEKKVEDLQEELRRKEDESRKDKAELDQLRKTDRERSEKITSLEVIVKEKDEVIRKLKSEVKNAKEELESSRSHVQEQTERYSQLQERLEQNEKQSQAEVDTLKERLIEVEQERDSGLQELKKRAAELEARSKDIQSLESMLANKNIGLAEVEAKLRSSYEEKLTAESGEKAQLILELDSVKKEASKAGKLLEVNKKMQERLKEKEAELKKLREDTEKLKADFDEAKKTLANEREVNAGLEKQLSTLRKELEESEKKLTGANETTKMMEAEVSSRTKQLESLRNELSEKSMREVSALEQLQAARREVEGLKEDHAKVNESLRLTISDAGEFRRLHEQAKAELLEKSEAAQVLHEKVAAFEEKLLKEEQKCKEIVEHKLLLEGKITALTVDLAAVTERIQSSVTTENKLSNQISELQNHCEDLESSLSQKEAIESELRQEIEGVMKELAASKAEVEDLQEQAKALSEDLSAAKKASYEFELQKNEIADREYRLEIELSQAKSALKESENSSAEQIANLKGRLHEAESDRTASLEKFNKLKKLFKDKNEAFESLNRELTGLKESYETVTELKSKLEVKVIDLEKQLKATQEDLDSLRNTMDSKTKAMESMSVSVSENEGKLQEVVARNKELESELKKVKDSLELTISNSQHDLTAAEKSVEVLRKDFEQARRALDAVSIEKRNSESECEDVKRELVASQTQLCVLQEELAGLKAEQAAMKDDLKAKEDAAGEVSKLLKDIDVLKGELDSSRVAAGFLEEMLRSKDIEVKAQRETIERLKAEVGEAKKATESEVIKKSKAELEKLEMDLDAQQKLIEERESRVESLEREVRTLEVVREEKEEVMKKYEKAVADLEQANANLVHDLDTARARLEKLESVVSSSSELEAVNQKCASDLEALQSEMNNAVSEKQELLRELELVREAFENEREEHSSAISDALKDVAARDADIQRLTMTVKELKNKLKDADSLKAMVRQLEARLASKEAQNNDFSEEVVSAANVQTLNASRSSELADELQQVSDAKAQLERKIALLDVQHREEMEELRRQLTKDREMEDVTLSSNGKRIFDDTEILVKDVQGNHVHEAEDIEALKRKHKYEVRELQRLLDTVQRHSRAYKDAPIEEVVELEYLRNILYDYMMGKEPMVLAKVLAAVVKFNKDQTRNILDREAKKSSLLGQMALR